MAFDIVAHGPLNLPNGIREYLSENFNREAGYGGKRIELALPVENKLRILVDVALQLLSSKFDFAELIPRVFRSWSPNSRHEEVSYEGGTRYKCDSREYDFRTVHIP